LANPEIPGRTEKNIASTLSRDVWRREEINFVTAVTAVHADRTNPSHPGAMRVRVRLCEIVDTSKAITEP
jgi:hypothetical protein